jgi:RHS repeat-associated protein
MSGFSDMGFIYDWRSTATTPTATCASGEVSRSPSHYRGEQFDSDLGLYYLRARYYNPSTGRFLSRDPEDGKIKISATLHKYLYASGDPVNRIDPTGRADFVEVENVDNVSITMGHGARHLVGTGLSQAEAEAAIEQVVREDIAADGGIDCKSIGMVVLSGIPIIYRVYLVDAACLIVNVGTYFPL